MKKCTCANWAREIEGLMSALMMSSLHGVEDAGEPFRYCPWCGRLLTESQDSWDQPEGKEKP